MLEIPQKVDPSWHDFIEQELSEDYMKNLMEFIDQEIQSGVKIYPSFNNIFSAFSLALADIKVVLLGQDPYHKQGQAMGLSFSVPSDQKIPPSLKRIFKEISQSNPDFIIPSHGDLSGWHQQGVFLLNSVLTVRESSPASHAKKGWEIFTDKVIQKISQQHNNTVFLLLGAYAQKKQMLIDEENNFILKAAHPSPLARTGFMGSNIFVDVNNKLESVNKTPIIWQI